MALRVSSILEDQDRKVPPPPPSPFTVASPPRGVDEAARRRIDDLRAEIVHLASLTADAVRAGTDAFVAGALDAAQCVIEDDDAIDALRHVVEDDCLYLLGHPGLDPVSLRFVGTALRTAQELERSADLMVNIARTTARLPPAALDPTECRLIERLGRQVGVQLRVAVNAFTDLDPSWSGALADMDETVDELERALVRHSLATSVGGPAGDAGVTRAVQLALVARHYERIGDHTVTIAEQVQFIVTGDRASRRRRRPHAER